MALLELKNLKTFFATKRGTVKAVNGVSFNIYPGETYGLVGESGSGKTTMLRLIAGFTMPTEGKILIEGKDVSAVPPFKRRVNTVFQKYALFPHLNVFNNIAFGLKLKYVPDGTYVDKKGVEYEKQRKLTKREIEEKVNAALKMVDLEDYGHRNVNSLSGGQQQRVAIARALVTGPSIICMDEPLSNLDAKLRMEMRQAIRKIQREVGITTVYVTHDQEEAMSISDTIAVMNAGKIQHIGTPRDIYQRPANTFVATFIGRTNILDARMEQGALVFPNGERFTRDSWAQIPDGPVKVSVRPEEFVVHHADEKVEGISAVLEDSVYLGLNTHYFLKLSSGASVELIQESTIDEKLEPGSTVTLTLKNEKINIFSEDGAKNYLRG